MRQEAGGRRQEAGGKRQEAGGTRHEVFNQTIACIAGTSHQHPAISTLSCCRVAGTDD